MALCCQARQISSGCGHPPSRALDLWRVQGIDLAAALAALWQGTPALRVRRQGERCEAGGQFVTHAAALPGNPYDGHTLGTVIPQMEALIGNVLDCCITDACYRGHNPTRSQVQGLHHRPEAPRHAADQARVQTAGRHRALIGHLKEHHRIGRNHSPIQAATPSTPCSPPLAITSAVSSRG